MSELMKTIAHPDEVIALLKYKLGGCNAVIPKCDYASMSPTLVLCYKYLSQTSRSFAAVIQALDVELRNAVCIFYLVLRALDTVEDDMTIPLTEKIPMLHKFHTLLRDPDWCYKDSQEKDRVVLEDFPTISHEYRQLSEVYQEVIAEICEKMGKGMTVFMEREIKSIEEWNEYCHYVAGLVGIGLSRLFVASKLEPEIVGQDEKLANNMGLFLQKTNIIRDYLEDQLDGRQFWPKASWSKFAKLLADFRLGENRKDAVACLNELITNTMELIPDCIKFLSLLQNQSVFNFCAIPQVMAIATLERCYNNPAVFTHVVKIRKGEAIRLMMEATNIEKVKAIMSHFVNKVQERVPIEDPNCIETKRVGQVALSCCQTDKEFTTSSIYPPLYMSMALMVAALVYTYWTQVSSLYPL